MDTGRFAVLTTLALSLGIVASTASAQSSDEESLEFLFGDEPAEQQQDASSGNEQPPQEASSRGADTNQDTDDNPEPYDDVIAVEDDSTAIPADDTPRRKPVVEEVIVTAQRREENLQDVAISITVVDQEQISNADMTNSADLANYTPSLSSNQRFGPENASFAIRGFTQDLRTTASVATYFAEVVAPRGQSSQTSGDGAGPGALFDLENVQVLKGPQGTLFGRNTTGGAVLIVPKKPTEEFEGYAEAMGGNLDALRAQAVVNFPVNDDIRLRFGVDHKERQGHLNNITGIGPDELGNVDYTAARLSLVWDITDDIENYSILSYVDSDTNGYTTRLFACNTDIVPSVADLTGLLRGILSGELGFDTLTSVANPFALFTAQPCQQQLADQEASGQDGFYDLQSSVPGTFTKIKEKRFINTTTWDITDNLTFKNIFAYAHLHTENGTNVFGTYFPDPTNPGGNREFTVGASVASPTIPVTSQETFVEEIQFQGLSLSDRLIWQAGLYYETSRPDGFSGNTSASFLYCDLGTIEQDPSQYDCFDPLGGFLGGVLVQEYKTEYLNQAVYAQATYDLLESLSATLGLRYTWDETEGYGIKTRYAYLAAVQQAPVQSITTPRVESQAPTGMLELNYRPFDGIMTYAKYTRGYRQGSVNLAADSGVDTHQEETVDTYEIGAKTSFGGWVPGRFNFSVFYNELKDQQLQGGYVSTNAGPTTAIFNAGESEIQGFEIEAFLQPLQFLTVALSYSYLDTELLEQGDRSDDVSEVGFLEGSTYTPIAVVGDELPFAPRHSYVANVNLFLPAPESWGLMSLGSTYAYTGEQRAAASNATPFDVLDDFSLLNFNLSWTEMFGSGFDVTLFGTNVLDEEYVTYVGGTYNIIGIESRGMGLPRTFGARMRYNF